MKQLIMDVLKDMAGGQINLASETARKSIANTIVAAMKTNKKGWFLDLGSIDGKPKLTEEEKEEKRYKEFWTCGICGEDTSEVDYDYLGSGTNHLGCELKTPEEVDEYIETVDKEQQEARGKYNLRKERGPDRRDGDRRKKNYSQKKHEDKVFYHDMGGNYSKYEAEKLKLAEEIVEGQEGAWIYESPDGGKTVFRRPFADYDMSKKEEIDWETKEPTGRVFTQYPFPPEDEEVK
jgi:hypothetical protein